MTAVVAGSPRAAGVTSRRYSIGVLTGHARGKEQQRQGNTRKSSLHENLEKVLRGRRGNPENLLGVGRLAFSSTISKLRERQPSTQNPRPTATKLCCHSCRRVKFGRGRHNQAASHTRLPAMFRVPSLIEAAMDIPPSLPIRKARAPRRFLPLLSVLLAAMLCTTSAASRAADEASPNQGAALPLAPTVPPPTNPALAVGTTPEVEQPSLFGRWCFWTAVGAVVAATVVIVVVSSRGQAPPSTDLGNQAFQP